MATGAGGRGGDSGCSFRDDITGRVTAWLIEAGKEWAYFGPALPSDGEPVQ